MSINSIQSVSQIYNQTQASDESAAQQLEDLLNEYRAHMEDADPTKALAILGEISDLLSKDSNLISEECFQNGFRPGQGGMDQNYAIFLKQTITLAQEAADYHKAHPSEMIPVSIRDQLEENTAQLLYLMTHKKP